MTEKQIKLCLVRISKAEFERLSNCEETYFQNSCIFEEATDNLVAFINIYGDISTYWKVENGR